MTFVRKERALVRIRAMSRILAAVKRIMGIT
jgi:hypothetical protein